MADSEDSREQTPNTAPSPRVSSDDVATHLLAELDQITPSATSQLQAFCSLAVKQMKQYPCLLEELHNNFQTLNTSLKHIDSRMVDLQEKEEERFGRIELEQKKMLQRLQDVERQVCEFTKWQKKIEVEIKENKSSSAAQTKEICKRMEILNGEHELVHKEHNARMTAIEEALETNAKIRDSINNRLEGLSVECDVHIDNYSQKNRGLISKLEDREAEALLLKEKIEALGEVVRKNVQGIEKVDAKQEPIENSITFLRKDFTVMERDLTETEYRIVELESFKETSEDHLNNHDRRITDLEQDDRVSKLECLYPRVSAVELQAKKQKAESDETKIILEKKIEGISLQVENISPKFWALMEEFDSLKEEMVFTKQSTIELSSELNATQDRLHCVQEDTLLLKQDQDTIQEQIIHFRESQSNEGHKVWSFVEEGLKTVPRKFELEDIRTEMTELKRDLLKEIEDSKHVVKFDLLHDPSPHVDHLKGYLKQQEEGQTQLKQKVLLLEQSLNAQQYVMQNVERNLNEGLHGLPSKDLLHEIEDIPRLKQRIQQMNQMLQNLQEQIVQYKKQLIDATTARASLSRCSSIRSSIIMNPSSATTTTMSFLKKQSMKTFRKTCFLDPEAQNTTASVKLGSTPPRSAESVHSSTIHGQDESKKIDHNILSPVQDSERYLPSSSFPSILTGDHQLTEST